MSSSFQIVRGLQGHHRLNADEPASPVFRILRTLTAPGVLGRRNAHVRGSAVDTLVDQSDLQLVNLALAAAL
jgi:hypothetical protein